ncbi:FAD-dependent oxidoreductase [Corallococcus sp. AB050B]|nr:FAD-dependent oxidoreductase [Corallococcus sp. AB050B]
MPCWLHTTQPVESLWAPGLMNIMEPVSPRKKIAIIGGGISGLFVAYLLKGRGWQVDVYEKAIRVGGNCHTVSMKVPRVSGGDNGILRWADMGVNDFNEPMYAEVYELMQALGVETPPLEDTASFFTADGNIVYTLDGGYETPMPIGFAKQLARFKGLATDVLHSSSYKGWTLRQFLKYPDFEFTNEFIQYCIFARANAMYFADDRDVGNMPVQSVMHYYVLQEGYGTNVPVKRRYIRGGSSAWAKKLCDASGAQVYTDRKVVSVNPLKGDAPEVVWREGSAQGSDTYTHVVFACHANQAADVLEPVLGDKEHGAAFVDMRRMLRSIKYTQTRAYAHLDASVLPRKEAWRTYNVRIRARGETPKPYSMTYVINRHQADAGNPHDDFLDCEQFFVSLAPDRKLDPSKILKDEHGKPLTRTFQHNVVDFHCIQAQQDLWGDEDNRIQGQAHLYFTGGWTVGAGLHIECWESAKQVVRLLSETARSSAQMTYEDSPSGRYEPEYIRRLVR